MSIIESVLREHREWVVCIFLPRTRVCDAGDLREGLSSSTLMQVSCPIHSWTQPQSTLLVVGGGKYLSGRLFLLTSTPYPSSPFKPLYFPSPCVLFLSSIYSISCISSLGWSIWGHWDLSRTKTELLGKPVVNVLYLCFSTHQITLQLLQPWLRMEKEDKQNRNTALAV